MAVVAFCAARFSLFSQCPLTKKEGCYPYVDGDRFVKISQKPHGGAPQIVFSHNKEHPSIEHWGLPNRAPTKFNPTQVLVDVFRPGTVEHQFVETTIVSSVVDDLVEFLEGRRVNDHIVFTRDKVLSLIPSDLLIQPPPNSVYKTQPAKPFPSWRRGKNNTGTNQQPSKPPHLFWDGIEQQLSFVGIPLDPNAETWQLNTPTGKFFIGRTKVKGPAEAIQEEYPKLKRIAFDMDKIQPNQNLYQIVCNLLQTTNPKTNQPYFNMLFMNGQLHHDLEARWEFLKLVLQRVGIDDKEFTAAAREKYLQYKADQARSLYARFHITGKEIKGFGIDAFWLLTGILPAISMHRLVKKMANSVAKTEVHSAENGGEKNSIQLERTDVPKQFYYDPSIQKTGHAIGVGLGLTTWVVWWLLMIWLITQGLGCYNRQATTFNQELEKASGFPALNAEEVETELAAPLNLSEKQVPLSPSPELEKRRPQVGRDYVTCEETWFSTVKKYPRFFGVNPSQGKTIASVAEDLQNHRGLPQQGEKVIPTGESFHD